ncbi:serine/threonine protein kinase [Yinghuangia sp. KLBMP8922]|uniref:non-specific serine/threonine protein kinase n=1 Tax=Yinghuangia soli TaxID=2908204 RepID=A0AA41U4S7_9ACTN|nr:serine/threonine protein kinase [Yinghuangia soli]
MGVEVAVKEVGLPHDSDADEPGSDSATVRADLVARAVREARNAARLRDHPHIVAVHDVVVEEGVPWIVMRLVVGRSLAEILASEGPLPAPRVTGIARALLGALQAAHATGVVHRDLKPANVMVTAQGQILLADFGIAVHETDTRLTTSGGIVGSVAYMAPERLDGDQDDGASDLFSLGVTLYEALEGVSPFRRETATGTLTAVVLHDPPPLRRGDPALARLIVGLLMKKPENRPSIAEALALLGDPGPVTAPPPFPHQTPQATPPPTPHQTPHGVSVQTAPHMPLHVPPPPVPPAAPAPPPRPRSTRRRAWIIAASVVAVALLAGLGVVLADRAADDGSGTAVDGVVTDPRTGISVPRLKGWSDLSGTAPGHQTTGAYPCPSDKRDIGCFLGEVAIHTLRGDSIEKAARDLLDEASDNPDFTLIRTVRNEPVTVDGKRAMWLMVEIRMKKPDGNGIVRSKSVQIIVVDNPFPDRNKQVFPLVVTALDKDTEAPAAGVLDVVRKGIKVAPPQPSTG